MTFSVANHADRFLTNYDERVYDLTKEQAQTEFLKMIKQERVPRPDTGTYEVRVWTGMESGFGKTVAVAQAQIAAATIDKWSISGNKLEQVGYIDKDYIDAGDVAAVDEAQSRTLDAALTELEKVLLGPANYSYGQAATGTTAGTIYLKNKADTYKFRVGWLVAASSDGTASGARSGTGTITALDANAGTITYTGTITSLAVGDYIYRGAATASHYMDMGVIPLLKHIPLGSPATVQGINKAGSLELQGTYLDASAYSLDKAIIETDAASRFIGGKASHVLMNYSRLGELMATRDSNRVREIDDEKIGFKSVMVFGNDGRPMRVVGVRFLPSNVAVGIDPTDFTLYHWGRKLWDPVDNGGVSLHLKSDSNTYEFRLNFKGDLVCKTPSKHWVAKLSA